jgi:hypothetical protein
MTLVRRERIMLDLPTLKAELEAAVLEETAARDEALNNAHRHDGSRQALLATISRIGQAIEAEENRNGVTREVSSDAIGRHDPTEAEGGPEGGSGSL